MKVQVRTRRDGVGLGGHVAAGGLFHGESTFLPVRVTVAAPQRVDRGRRAACWQEGTVVLDRADLRTQRVTRGPVGVERDGHRQQVRAVPERPEPHLGRAPRTGRTHPGSGLGSSTGIARSTPRLTLPKRARWSRSCSLSAPRRERPRRQPRRDSADHRGRQPRRSEHRVPVPGRATRASPRARSRRPAPAPAPRARPAWRPGPVARGGRPSLPMMVK